MSDILKNNLEFISKHNKTLCDKILQIKEYTKSFDLRPNLAGEYNLLIDGMAVHSLTGAGQEAKSLKDSLPYTSANTIHIIYGLGLGYLADEFINNSKGKVLVIEPDTEVLHYVLSAVDFSQNFKTNRLYIASDNQEFEQILFTLYKYKSNATLSCLDFYRIRHRDSYTEFSDWLKREIELVDHNFNLQIRKTFVFFKEMLESLDKKYNLPFLTDYKDSFKGKPAIIASAGPSLGENIEVLKKYKDNAIIFCVGTALRTLCEGGVVPDFLNVIETVNTSLHYDVPISKDINFIAEPFTEKSYLDIEFKRRIMAPSLETDAARWFLETIGREFIPFDTKGTVSYHALFSAYYLGCDPIILIGQDLAYSGGKCYAKGSKFDGLECVLDEQTKQYKIAPKNYEEYRDSYINSDKFTAEEKSKYVDKRLDELNKNLKFVPGQNNEILPTDAVYSIFIDYFQHFASVYKNERTLINSSVGGALIKGFETVPLEKAFEKFAVNPIDKETLFETFDKPALCDSVSIIKKLKKELKILKETMPILEEGFIISKKIKDLIAKGTGYTAQMDKPLDTLSRLYNVMTKKYMVKFRSVKIVHAYYYCKLSALIAENNVIDNDNQLKLYSARYYEYFNKGKIKTLAAIELIEKAIAKLEDADESCFAKG